MRAYDMGGGKKLLIWFGSFGLAIGALYGVRKWRDHDTAHDERLQAALAVREQLADFTRCLSGYGDTSDLRKVIAFRAATGELEPATCERIGREAQEMMVAFARRIDVRVEVPRESLFLSGLPEINFMDRFCAWYLGVYGETERLVEATGGTRGTPPRCDADTNLALIAGATELSDDARNDADFLVRDGLFLAHKRKLGETVTLARTKEGTSWSTLESPPGSTMTPVWNAWNDDGLMTVTGKTGTYTIHVAEGNRWEARARLKLPGVASITPTRGGAIVVSTGADRAAFTALRSTDEAKTFGAPIRLFKTARENGPYHVATRGRPDGSLVVMTMPEIGAARFDAFLLDSTAKVPTSTASFTWNEPGEGRAILTCSEGETTWALVRQRHVAVSRDGGRSWVQLDGINDDLKRPQLTCNKERLAIVDPHLRMFYTCGRVDCGGVAFPDGKYALTAAKLEPTTELWLGSEFADVHFREGKAITVMVYRLDGAQLTPDRVHVVETAGRLPLAFDSGQFMYLRR